MGDEETANAAISYGVDSNWYADSGATDHVMGELDKLVMRDAYHGIDQIYTASGSGMRINHIGQSIIRTPHRDHHLNHVLHVPQASKNIAVFFSFILISFFIKDRESRKTLLQGKSRGGLYPLPCSLATASSKQVLSTSKISTSRWHARLGHPSSPLLDLCLEKIVYHLLEIPLQK